MIKAAVIGDPISHSLSPKLHGFLLKKYGIDGSYQAIRVESCDLEKRIDGLLNQEGFAGLNITIPHKENSFQIFEKNGYFLSEAAHLMRAINTVYKENGKICATSSDGFGFVKNLEFFANQEFMAKPSKTALILGAGGAAKSVIPDLIARGFDKIRIINRSQDKALALIEQYHNFDAEISLVQKIESDVDLLVNATSLGMKGQPTLSLDLSALRKDTYVYDIVYNPLMTDLLKEAQKHGNPVITGVGMLIFQAFAGFEKWFGVRPELTRGEFDELVRELMSSL